MNKKITGHIISETLPDNEEYLTKNGLDVCLVAMAETLKGRIPKKVTFELSTSPLKDFKKAKFMGKGRGHAVCLSVKDEKKLWHVLDSNGTFWIPEAWREALNLMGRPKVFYWRIK
jgi:hypothetical protein